MKNMKKTKKFIEMMAFASTFIEEFFGKNASRTPETEKFVTMIDSIIKLMSTEKPGGEEAKKIMKFMTNIRSIVVTGDYYQKEAMGVWMWYGGLSSGVDLDEITECARTIGNLQKKAINMDRKQTVKASRELYKDLLSSPRPATEIQRGSPEGDFGRRIAKKLEGEIDSEDFGKSEPMALIVGGIPSIIPDILDFVKEGNLKDYLYYKVPQYLNGYLGMVEGDFSKILTYLIAIIEIGDRKKIDYTMLRKKLIGKKAKILQERGYSILIKSYDRHIRNSIAHENWSVDYDKMTIELRDKDWKKKIPIIKVEEGKMSAMILKGLWTRMAMIEELVLLMSSPKDKELTRKLCYHRDPAWVKKIKELHQKNNLEKERACR